MITAVPSLTIRGARPAAFLIAPLSVQGRPNQNGKAHVPLHESGRAIHHRQESSDQAPNANACAERWVHTIGADCLDRILILGRRHLDNVLRVYRRHYNEHRPQRALHLLPPNGRDPGTNLRSQASPSEDVNTHANTTVSPRPTMAIR